MNVVLKADGFGALEALKEVVRGVAARTSLVGVRVLGSGVGDVNPGDLQRLEGPGKALGLVLAFNVGVCDSNTRALANELDLRVVREGVVFRLEEALAAALQALMPQERVALLQVP